MTNIGLKQYTSFLSTRNGIAIKGVWANDSKGWKRFNIKPKLFFTGPEEGHHARGINDEYLHKIDIASMPHAKEVIKTYKDVSNAKVFGSKNFQGAFISDHYDNTDYNESLVKRWYFDIETECEDGFPEPELAEERINLITLKSFEKNSYDVFVYSPAHYPTIDKKYDVTWHIFDNEIEMLKGFVEWFRTIDLDVLTGWNSESFDIPYIVNRIKNVIGGDYYTNLSPVKQVRQRVVKSKWGEYTTYDILGVSHIDMMAAYRKFIFTPRESYSLDFISEEELDANKLRHSSGIPGHLLYREYFTDAIEYNIRDVELLEMLDKKLNLLGLIISMAYMGKINFNDVLGTVKFSESLIYDYLSKQNIFHQVNKSDHPNRSINGGWVKAVIPGKYRWVCTFDLASLYPSVMRAFNISPDTLVNAPRTPQNLSSDYINGLSHKDEGITYTANGATYTKAKKGFIPQILDYTVGERAVAKGLLMDAKKEVGKYAGKEKGLKEYEIQKLDTKQLALKLIGNSIYGALACQYFHFYNPDIAESITLTGQVIDRWMGKYLNGALNKVCGTKSVDYIIGADTDSLFLNLEVLVKKQFGDVELTQEKVDWVVKFCDTTLKKVIDQAFDKLAENMCVYDRKPIDADREVVSSASVHLAKKRYFMSVFNMEGVKFPLDKPYLKVTGVEAVRSSTPKFCRVHMKELFMSILLEGHAESFDHIERIRKSILSEGIQEIAANTSVNNIEKYELDGHYIKGTPSHVKAAITYNSLIKDEFGELFEKIKSGDHIKHTALRIPNPTGEERIAWKGDLPTELFDKCKITPYIDADSQYEKTFKKPMRGIFEALDWNIDYKETLDI